MGMTREQMMGSLKGIFILQYFKPEEVGPYSEIIFDACGWMDGYKFDLAVKEVIKSLKTNVRLKPGHFISAYKDLAERNGWQNLKMSRGCASCGGILFVYVWVKDKKNNEFRGVKGCPECNSRYNGIHGDFTEITGPTFERIDGSLSNLRRIPLAFAQLLLNLMGHMTTKPRESLVEALVDASCQPEVRNVSPRYNPVVRKNEMIRDLIEASPVRVVEAGMVEEEPAKTEPLSAPAEQPSPAAPTKVKKAKVQPAEPERVIF